MDHIQNLKERMSYSRLSSRLSSHFTYQNLKLDASSTKRLAVYVGLCTTAILVNIFIFTRLGMLRYSSFQHEITLKTQTPWPDIAWLVAFPNSGDDYTRALLQRVSQTATATNYGNELGERYRDIPFVARGEGGPFRANDLPFPDRYIVTTTYCTNTCIDCNTRYVQGNKDFLSGCAAGHHVLDDSDRRLVRYDPGIVKKAVHLIRDPLENIVARFHYLYKRDRRQGNNDEWNYTNDRDGFLRWCVDKDEKYVVQEEKWLRDDVANAAKDIPCHGAFHQYALWHNKVFETLDESHIQAYVVHYNDYKEDIEGTTKNLFKFLELPVINAAPEFTGDDYSQFYTEEDRLKISLFLKVVSSQPTWTQIKKYLPPPTVESNIYAPIGSILSPYYGTWPSIAWMMSFPNSGTYFMTHLVEIGSGTATATNYANELGPRFYDIPNVAYGPNGPYRTTKRTFPEKYIITKTHCTGYCTQYTECPPSLYIKTKDQFLEKCARGGKFENGDNNNNNDGGLAKIYYDPSEVKRVLHLIRDPFDNVVARFHFAHKKHRTMGDGDSWSYTYDKDGFREWCRMADARFVKEEESLYRPEVLAASRDVPCHGEFFQYIQWHNNAFEVPDMLGGVPSQVVYYEDNHYDIEGVVSNMFGFLELESNGNVPPFMYSGGYGDYYSTDERQSIISFIELIGSPRTVDHMKRYFKKPPAMKKKKKGFGLRLFSD